jgi:hypothetical protein
LRYPFLSNTLEKHQNFDQKTSYLHPSKNNLKSLLLSLSLSLSSFPFVVKEEEGQWGTPKAREVATEEIQNNSTSPLEILWRIRWKL